MTPEQHRYQMLLQHSRRLMAAVGRDLATIANAREERAWLREAVPGIPKLMCKESDHKEAVE